MIACQHPDVSSHIYLLFCAYCQWMEVNTWWLMNSMMIQFNCENVFLLLFNLYFPAFIEVLLWYHHHIHILSRFPVLVSSLKTIVSILTCMINLLWFFNPLFFNPFTLIYWVLLQSMPPARSSAEVVGSAPALVARANTRSPWPNPARARPGGGPDRLGYRSWPATQLTTDLSLSLPTFFTVNR